MKGVYPRNNLSKIRDGAYGRNLDEYKSIEIHSIDVHANGDNLTKLIALGLNIFQKNKR